MKIEWDPFAHQDLNEIIEYIVTEGSSQAALDIHEKIYKQISILENHPQAGRQGRVMDTRELVIVRTPYIFAYTIRNDSISILRILHGTRKWSLSSLHPIKRYEDSMI